MSRRITENGSNKVHDEDEVACILKEKEDNDKDEKNKKGRETSQENSNSDLIQEYGNRVVIDKTSKKSKKKKALSEFRRLVEDAIVGHYLLEKPDRNVCPREAAMAKEQFKNITLWGVPLLPSAGHEGTDVVLLKFLKAKDFKVNEALEMLQKNLKWRKETNTDSILGEDLDPDLEKIMYMNCKDKEGRPLHYHDFGALKDKELSRKIFETRDTCEKLLRLKIQSMEKGVKELSFKPGGANSMVHITDLNHSNPPAIKDFRLVSKKIYTMLQDNYPELIHRNIIINVPFWYYACYILSSKFLSQRSKRKFVFARPANTTKTLLKYISPENLPVEYGGLYRENDEFFPEDRASELIVKKNSTGCIQIPVAEAGVTMIWDLTTVGWDVYYKEEFIPDDEGSYTVLIQNENEKKGEESIRNSFYINEPGKIVITIDNLSLKKKRVFYRFKTKPTVPMYVIFEK